MLTRPWIFEAKACLCPIIYLFVFTVVLGCVVSLTMSALRRIRRQSGKRRRQQPSPIRQRSDGPARPGSPERIDLDHSELEAILERARASLSPEQYDTLHAALETLLFLTQELEKKRVSVQRLKQLLFGATTEKTRKVLEKALNEAGNSL